MAASHRDEPRDEPDPAEQSPAEHGFPMAGDPFPDDESAAPADTRRELTALEMMDAPARPDERTRKAVLWMALSFATVMFVLTIGVIVSSGLDILEVFTVILLSGIIYGLVGALRYKGDDPMAQFDPPPLPKRRFGRGRRRDER
ncbi:MAG: hypothetical protein HZB14_06535 [Actinobacteria bacterium]|nr:hypothetical protein [Actinomycetota bacterium]